MNFEIPIIQSLNQIKFTDIVIALLVLFVIIDFHLHLQKSKKMSVNDSIYINWDNTLNKAVLVLYLGNGRTLNTVLTKEQFQSLRNDLNDIDNELKGNGKLNSVNVLSKNKPAIKIKNQNTEIPLKLLKKYQADKRKLQYFEQKIANKKDKNKIQK
ncbi:MAG: hypothetical protein N4R13_07845 [Lactobacillus crispatus]|nr:hypothetical protein [Lactobacillus crispatus]MCT7816707.1 hypothetical protein [Lactobacillus crispatus]